MGSINPMRVVENSEPSLDFKIGQMLMVGFRGLEVGDDSPIVEQLKNYNIGGVVLYSKDVTTNSYVRNIISPSQLRRLTAGLQSYAKAPLLIGIDQEGGRVGRLNKKNGFASTYSAQYLGKADSLPITRDNGENIADMLWQSGINVNFAPVVDLNINPLNPIIGGLERSISADSDAVVRHASQFIEAHHQRGIMCALKHFPGHGSSKDDSHLGITDVTQTWSDVELQPYRDLIGNGLADMVMTAHVYNSSWDEKYPATLSERVITGILREQLGYDGVIISDDMQMGAIANYFGFEAAIEKSVEAGVDIILISNNSVFDEKAAEKAFNTIKKMVLTGKVSAARINESYRRISALKERLYKTPYCVQGLESEKTGKCLCRPAEEFSTDEIRACINDLLYHPDISQSDKELLSIVVQKGKAHLFNFLHGYTRLDAVGSWREVGRDGKVIKVYPDEENVQFDIEFRDRADEAVNRGLMSLLTVYNRREVGEQLLYIRTSSIEDSSL